MGSSSSLIAGNPQKELKCSICLSTYTNPKTLPCLHTFCCHCLDELAAKSRENRQQIVCPECRIIIDLPRGNSFDEFATKCYVNRLTDTVSVQRQGTQVLGGTINPRQNNESQQLEKARTEAAKSRLKQLEAKAQERAEILTKQANKDTETRSRIRQQIKQTREAIQQDSQRLMELLKRHEQKLLTEVDAFEEDAENMFDHQADDLQLHQGQLNSIIQHLRSVRLQGRSDVLKAEPSAISRTQEVFDALANYQPLKSVHVEYKPDEGASRRLEKSLLGRVYSGLADSQKTHHVTTRVLPLANSLSDIHVTKRRPRGYKAVATFGSSKGDFNDFCGIAVNRAWDVAVTVNDNHRVQIFSADGQYLREFGTKGTADGQFSCPAGLAYNKAGHIVVADELQTSLYSRVQVFSSTGHWISTFGQDALKQPCGVSVTCDDNIMVCDVEVKTVNVFSPEGMLFLQFTPGNIPMSAIFCHDKYFVSLDSHVIKVFDSRGSWLYDIGQQGDGAAQFQLPWGLAVNTDDLLFVCDSINGRVQVFTLDGEFVVSFGSRGSGLGQLDCPCFIAVSSDGRVFVTDRDNHRVQVFQAYY